MQEGNEDSGRKEEWKKRKKEIINTRKFINIRIFLLCIESTKEIRTVEGRKEECKKRKRKERNHKKKEEIRNHKYQKIYKRHNIPMYS